MPRDDRKNKVRGPYIDPDEYEKLTKLAESKDMSVRDALNELINVTINESGQITVNPVNAKFKD